MALAGGLVLLVPAHAQVVPAAPPGGFMSQADVTQCMRYRRTAEDQHASIVAEGIALEHVAAAFRSEAGRLRDQFADLQKRERDQAAAESQSTGLHTGVDLGRNAVADLQREIDRSASLQAELDLARERYNRELSDHNRRFAIHRIKIDQLNQRADALSAMLKKIDIRCPPDRMRAEDRRVAKSQLAAEAASRVQR